MTYEKALEYIHGISWTFCKPGLERISELCEKLGNPQDRLKFIHVAGTNGKGSFCSMLSEVLMAAGYKVGLYTSPYIVEFNERMRVCGVNISNRELAEITAEVKPIADKMEDKPTEFELITAIAFVYFARHGVDLVVLEAGMGGRLDSTNVIKTPALSVITGISLDHTAFLGDTVEKIAAEKAGIIKRGVPVLYGGLDGAALEVIKAVADEKKSPLYTVQRDDIIIKESNLCGTVFDFGSFKDIRLTLLGTYQPHNAANVLSAIGVLLTQGYKISTAHIKAGLERAKWPARFEIIGNAPLTIYDGAHNAEGIESAVESIRHYFGTDKVYAVSGVLKDKEYKKIAATLATVAERVFTLTPDNPRALKAEEYAKILRECGVDATPCANIGAAVMAARAAALKDNKPLICLGSLYIYGEVKKAIKEN